MIAPARPLTPVFPARRPLAVARPDRLLHRLARRDPAPADPARLRTLLADYGLAVQGALTALPGGGRGQSWIVETQDGRKLLKRYKGTVEPETIRHEHSILGFLGALGFAAPRVVRTTWGETMLWRDDEGFVLFDLLEGYFQYHEYLFFPPQTEQFVTASAQALAALHRALRDFTPEGHNPNGFRSRTGERWRELGWFAERLAACQAPSSALPASEAAAFRRTLAKESAWVEASLHSLDVSLRETQLPRLIIHGDYGPYNLFFRWGAPVVVLDFELARLDWRLTDLATALPSFARTRLGFRFDRARAFVRAYRAAFPIEEAEGALLPAVWQFLTLRRVVVFWHRYWQTGKPAWRVAAQQKLELARWIERHERRLADELMT